MSAVMRAQDESRRLGQDYIGTEMLLVGVAASGGADAGCRALQRFEVTLPEARTLLERVVGRGTGSRGGQDTYFTLGAKKVLQDATGCALEQGASEVSTAHLLRAVLRQENGNGARLLRQMLRLDGSFLDQFFAVLTLEECVDKVRSKRSL